MTVFDIREFLNPDQVAIQITDQYINLKNGRNNKEAQWKELRDYVFATDTTTTTNSKLPWKNKTTRPKLCQIRDNLHANYMSALFPNDQWFKWEAQEDDGISKDKAIAIEAYMYQKFRESKFKETVSRYVYDFIDFGNVFGDVEFVNEITEDKDQKIAAYVGPRLVRISPYDIVFDIRAASFQQSPKIVRTLLSFGQVEKLRQSNPDWAKVGEEVFNKIKYNRKTLLPNIKSLAKADFQKVQNLVADGFNTLTDYYSSGMVEFLEFEGDLFDPLTGEIKQNYVITIVDRCYVVRQEPIRNWFARSYKQHCGWRLRPDNLFAMGPLDNLVGLQYRIDHLENLKADVFDLIAFPVLKIKGFVEDFEYGPYERIYMEQDSDVEALAPDTTALNADLEIARLEQVMEDMAGAPKQAMGIRTPGEKTAYEVSELQNAASRMFQNKISYFEENFLEPLMNSMLEIARRNMQAEEVVRVIDNEQGVVQFMSISPDDIKARGSLIPLGARHFAAQNQLVQNLSQLSGTGLYQDPSVINHLSGKRMAQLLEENLGLEKYHLYRPNVRVEEQLETQQLMHQAQEELMVNNMTPTATSQDTPTEGPPQQDTTNNATG